MAGSGPPTPNYRWPTPADSDPLPDGAGHICDLGKGVDASLKVVDGKLPSVLERVSQSWANSEFESTSVRGGRNRTTAGAGRKIVGGLSSATIGGFAVGSFQLPAGFSVVDSVVVTPHGRAKWPGAGNVESWFTAHVLDWSATAVRVVCIATTISTSGVDWPGSAGTPLDQGCTATLWLVAGGS